jgi:hypothetical protein
MVQSNLEEPAAVPLAGAGNIEEMAEREGWSPDDYVLALADHIRHPSVRLTAQRERLQALASLSELGDRTVGGALAQHFQILEALVQRYALAAEQYLTKGGPHSLEISERMLGCSVRAQTAALRVASALTALRQQAAANIASSAPTTMAAETAPAPAIGATAGGTAVE